MLCRFLFYFFFFVFYIAKYFFFFFKQKTAYEMTCDWSSDVCSSDLLPTVQGQGAKQTGAEESISDRDADHVRETQRMVLPRTCGAGWLLQSERRMFGNQPVR